MRQIVLLAVVAVAITAPLAVAAAPPTVLVAALTGTYLHTTSKGAGTARITITPTHVCWKFTWHGLDTPGVSGIHIAPPAPEGKHTTSIVPFTSSTSQKRGCESVNRWGPQMSGWVTKVAADPTHFFVIVGTDNYPAGAIGGPLRRG